jgi:hypothetical protein
VLLLPPLNMQLQHTQHTTSARQPTALQTNTTRTLSWTSCCTGCSQQQAAADGVAEDH